jgi:PAS domain S-box-containing protein
MSPTTNFLLMLAELWFFSGFVLLLHRYSDRIGLAPLMVTLGGITAALQTQSMGWVEVQVGNLSVNPDSYVLLPVLLLGLLVVYVVNGTYQARVVLAGMILVTAMVGFFQLFLPLHAQLPGSIIEADAIPGYPLEIFVGSVVALIVDMILLIVVYQAVCNLRGRSPGRLAGGFALISALWVDAIIFPLISSLGDVGSMNIILIHLVGKTLAGLALFPLLAYYLHWVAPRFPDSAAKTPRPVLDFFTTTLQLESRVRYHYSLLRTLSQVNELVLGSTEPEALLQQTCELLQTVRDYLLVWIALPAEESDELYPAAHAGNEEGYQAAIAALQETSPTYQTFREGRSVIPHPRVGTKELVSTFHRIIDKEEDCGSLSFPMRHASRTLGVLNVCVAAIRDLDRTEIDLLQELADDLAYALVSLKARSQQVILQTAADNMRDGLLILDLDGTIIYSNSAITRFIGEDGESVIGKDIRVYAPPSIPRQYLEKAFQTVISGRAFTTEFDYTAVTGRAFVISLYATLVRDEQEQPRYIVINIRNVTDRHHYEHQLLTLNRLTTNLVQIHDTPTLLQTILETSEDLLRADASGIYFVDPDTFQIQDTLTHSLPEEYSQRIARDYRGLPGETAAETFQPVHVGDTLQDSTYGERIHFMADYGIRALLILPILYREFPIGALTVYYHQPRNFDETQLQLGLTLAQTLAIVIQNAHLYQAEQNQRDLAEALAQAAASLSSSLELDDVLDHILEQAMSVISCKAVNIMMVQDDRAYIARHRGYEEYPDAGRVIISYQPPLTMPTLQQMIATGEPVLIPDTTQDATWSQFPGTDWIRGYVGIPLRIDGQTVGFLNVDSERANFLTSETVHHLQTFADHAATAIRNARLYEDSRRRADELAALVTAATTLSSGLEVEQVLQVVAEQITRSVNAHACAISDYDPVANTVTLMVEYDPESWVSNQEWYQPYDLDEYPRTLQVLETHTLVQQRISDPDVDPAEHKLMDDMGIKTLLMVPLVAQNQTIGLMELMHTEIEHTYTEQEIALVETLASQAAIAIENARLYERLQRHADELEDRVRQRTIELNEAKESIEGILASVPDAVFVLDENDQLLQANQAGEALLAQAQQHHLDLFAPDFLADLQLHDSPVVRAVLEVAGRAYQGLASRILRDDGQSTRQVVVFRDVTPFRELDRMKTQFISDVSHELRTPLTNLTLYIDLLTKVTDRRNQERYLETLQRETQRLTHLIEDLLTISRLEAGRVVVQLRPVDLNLLVDELTRDRIALAAKSEITLSCVLDPTLPRTLIDPHLLTQALSNLLTNAVNYTPAGGSIIMETAKETLGGIQWVTIRVSDTGVGIPANELERIFDRFYRGSASRQTGIAGTGLGLAISKQIVDRLGGRISVKSNAGQGSTFTVWLRVAA